MMYFLKKMNTRNKGIETSATAAICTGKLVSPEVASVKALRRPLVISCISWSLATRFGHIYEFQAPIIFSMVIEMMVGIARGIITFQRYFRSLVPSTFAARYKESGICIKL